MKFYEMIVRTTEKDSVRLIKALGWKGIVTFDSLEKSSGIEVYKGIEISGNKYKIKKVARKIRKKFHIIAAKGGTAELNRAILETPEIDILTDHILQDNTCGINHILARIAAKNNVAICFEFGKLLRSSGKTRAKIFSSYVETAKFVRKYNAPFVISSGALSKWELRSPSELISFGKLLGFEEPEIKRALSGDVIKENEKRISVKWVMPGVEIE